MDSRIPTRRRSRSRALSEADVEIVVAALGVLRSWVARETGTRLLEAITAIAVDRGRDARIRVAALDALSDLPDHLVRPIREQAPPPEAAGPPLDNPVAAREWIEAHGGKATLATLHDAIKAFRDSESRADTSRGRDEWIRARGAAHQIWPSAEPACLVRRARNLQQRAGSAATGIPRSHGRLGDARCLEPLARAWAATRDASWRAQLAEAARRIVTRSKLGGRNAVVKEYPRELGRVYLELPTPKRVGFQVVVGLAPSSRRCSVRVANGLPSTRTSTA